VALSGDEIRHRLTTFAAKWSVYNGSEEAGAQTFLTQLLDCYGTDREQVGDFESFKDKGFRDFYWPGVCIIEMKAPKESGRLSKHRAQLKRYWEEADDAAAGVRRPRFSVLCAFNKLEIWECGSYSKPRAILDLVDLPDHYDALLFLAGGEPHFNTDSTEVTRDAVRLVSDLYERLRDRRAADSEVLRNFLLQSVWCMFAEDLGLIDAHRFTQMLEALRDDPRRSSKDDLGRLFEYLNTPASEARHGMYEGVPYANGGLFADPAHVHLEHDELVLLHKAANSYQWDKVHPTIFGSLLEGVLSDRKHELGAHYTSEADIQKIVQPSIVEPWTERIDNITTHKQAVAAQNDLMNYVVLDPACGSGNFLYVAYQELRRIEKRLREREGELRRQSGKAGGESLSVFFPLSNMKGIEIDGFAVALARVTLWMGHTIAVRQLDLDEATLPLADLSGIQQGNALRAEWPRADVIIGNPPFHGDRNLRREIGDVEIDFLKREFGVGVKDFCVYWFRKAQDHLEPGKRAGLVATNSVSQNRARGASLEYVVESGGVITNAVGSQPWSGDASVHVSIVNWIKRPLVQPREFELNGEEVPGITTSLRSSGGVDLSTAARLPANRGISFQGILPGAAGFLVDEGVAKSLLADESAPYLDVVRPYLHGKDIAQGVDARPRAWIIDFGAMPLEAAQDYPAALDVVRKNAKVARESSNSYGRNPRWWQCLWPRPDMRRATRGLSRYLVTNRVGKRFPFVFADPWWCPSDKAIVFAFAGDYELGVLNSATHAHWVLGQNATLGATPTYTPSSAFETFPWPEPTDEQREAIAEIARRLDARRREICLEREIGLTTLYNQVDEGAWADLQQLHVALDEAVAEAYGWPKAVARDPDESNRRLLALNQAIAAGEVDYDPFRSRAPIASS
jgi:hypothetical protein